MADRRKDFVERLNKKKAAKESGMVMEAPVSTAFVRDENKWSVVSIYGPKGPYADSDHNTFVMHGSYPTEEEANAEMERILKSVDGLKYTQTVVWPTGEPLAMPLKPHTGVKRIFADNQKRAQEQWERMSRQMESEAEELRQRTMLAKKVYEKKHGAGSMPEPKVEQAKNEE